MSMSNEKAAESLAAVEDTISRTRKAIASTYESPFLIVWGVVWVSGFLGTHFFLQWVNWIWGFLCTVGTAATVVICWRQFRVWAPTKSSGERRIGLRTSLFWPLFFLYAFVWLSIMEPHSGIQMNAFLCTAVMFAYVVIGLWFDSWIMVFLGLGVTASTLAGLYLISPAYYCLWMAFAGGGPLLVTGLYLGLRWK